MLNTYLIKKKKKEKSGFQTRRRKSAVDTPMPSTLHQNITLVDLGIQVSTATTSHSVYLQWCAVNCINKNNNNS
jgi:hypothetical protein